MSAELLSRFVSNYTVAVLVEVGYPTVFLFKYISIYNIVAPRELRESIGHFTMKDRKNPCIRVNSLASSLSFSFPLKSTLFSSLCDL